MINNNLNILLDLNNIDLSNFYILNPINNNILSKGIFYKIIYSNSIFNLNTIYINFKINIINNNSKKIDFTINDNYKNKLINIEKHLLKCVNNNKTDNYRLKNIIESNQIPVTNLNTNNNKDIILSITGIWEDNNSKGINFKFIHQ